jgi:hypothetical protein
MDSATAAPTAGTDVMILKIFSQKNSAKKWRFLLETKLML